MRKNYISTAKQDVNPAACKFAAPTNVLSVAKVISDYWNTGKASLLKTAIITDNFWCRIYADVTQHLLIHALPSTYDILGRIELLHPDHWTGLESPSTYDELFLPMIKAMRQLEDYYTERLDTDGPFFNEDANRVFREAINAKSGKVANVPAWIGRTYGDGGPLWERCVYICRDDTDIPFEAGGYYFAGSEMNGSLPWMALALCCKAAYFVAVDGERGAHRASAWLAKHLRELVDAYTTSMNPRLRDFALRCLFGGLGVEYHAWGDSHHQLLARALRLLVPDEPWPVDGPKRRGRFRDLRGLPFGHLTALEPLTGSGKGRTSWRCRCACGKETVATSDELLRAHAVSCGDSKCPPRVLDIPARTADALASFTSRKTANTTTLRRGPAACPERVTTADEFTFASLEEWIHFLGLPIGPDMHAHRINHESGEDVPYAPGSVIYEAGKINRGLKYSNRLTYIPLMDEGLATVPTAEQAATLWGVKSATVRKWHERYPAKEGFIQAILSRVPLIDVADLPKCATIIREPESLESLL
jgi:hypothetical protein